MKNELTPLFHEVKKAKDEAWAHWQAMSVLLQSVCDHTFDIEDESGFKGCRDCGYWCTHEPYNLLADEDRYPECMICGKVLSGDEDASGEPEGDL